MEETASKKRRLGTTSRNPYLSRGSSHDENENENESKDTTFQRHDNQPHATSASTAPESTSCANETNIEEKKEDEGTSSKSKQAAPSFGLSYWERLPSKNLSFGPAEILTVDECVRHAELYCNKSVRVTGQLHQRSFVADNSSVPNQVLIELIDPIPSDPLHSTDKTPPTKARSHSLSVRTPTVARSSLVETPDTVSKALFKTPSKTLGPRRHAASSSLLKGSTRKVDTPQQLHGKISKPWFTSSHRKKPPPKAPPRMVLKVLADPILPGLSSIEPSGASKIMVMGTLLESGLLEARIVSQLPPSTDMALYFNALKFRRKFLLQRYKSKIQETNCAPTQQTPTREHSAQSQAPTTSSLLLGCGPPPYDVSEQT